MHYIFSDGLSSCISVFFSLACICLNIRLEDNVDNEYAVELYNYTV